jgi:release factor glutamine methyltransferase
LETLNPVTETNPAINQNIFEFKRREIYWQLKEIGLEEQECLAEARLIIEHISGIKEAEQLIKNIDEFPIQWQQEITRIINLRRERRPLAYCLGEIEFGGLKFRVIPGVLIPRTDTETLVEAIVEWIEKTRVEARDEAEAAPNNVTTIAEIGIGSGIIAISLLKRLPHCKVWACDISQTAITTALGNARRHGVHERLTLVHGDWRKVLPNDFDVIVSNPPYVSSLLNPKHMKHKNKSATKLEPEIHFEPEEALYAGEDGLDFYRDFAAILPGHYKKVKAGTKELNLFGAFEIGDNQEQSVISIFKSHGWQKLESKNDINGLARVITCIAPDS